MSCAINYLKSDLEKLHKDDWKLSFLVSIDCYKIANARALPSQLSSHSLSGKSLQQPSTSEGLQ